MDIITNNEIPIGFGMALAKDSKIMNAFSNLPSERREAIINGSRSIKSKHEMEEYVQRMVSSNDKTF